MRFTIRWFVIVALFFAAVAVFFSVYAHILLDYSLDHLEYALSVTERKAVTASPHSQRLYQSFVRDITLEEAARDRPDYSNMVLLDVATRSLGEVADRAGRERASLYLREVIKKKKHQRGRFLSATDKFHQNFRDFTHFMMALGRYFHTRLREGRQTLKGAMDFSAVYLISRADAKVSTGRLDQAAELYEKFLELYPEHADRGFVALSLARILLQQNRWNEAEAVLSEILRSHRGYEEADLAGRLLTRANLLQDRSRLIPLLSNQIQAQADFPAAADALRLKLGLTHLSMQQFQEAEDVLARLQNAEDPGVRQKAAFFLGLLYKLRSEYDRSASLFSGLVEVPELDRELGLGLYAELADLYYLKGDVPRALEHLNRLSEKVREAEQEGVEVAQAAWLSLAETERANIYQFDLGDTAAAGSRLEALGALVPGSDQVRVFEAELLKGSSVSLRDRAFQALAAGNVHLAYDLFLKNHRMYPRDAWTLSGLGTVYLLFAELAESEQFAERGYREKGDEYTASVLGYVKGFLERYGEAIGHYQTALSYNEKYIPARFNLACLYLETRQYEEAFESLKGLEGLLHPKDAYMRSKILNNRGYAQWWLSKPDEARKNFQEALKWTPAFDLAKRNLSHMAAGKTPEMVSFKE